MMGRFSLVLLATVAWSPRVEADAKAPTPRDKEISKIVSKYMEQGHISRHALDDEISTRLYRGFLKVLDPLKIYLLQSDIDEFSPRMTELDEDAKAGQSLEFPFALYQRFLQRLDERVTWADEFIEAEHDFTQEETIVVDPDTATYAKDAAESKERWRVRIKFELISLTIDDKTKDEAKERLHKRYRALKSRWHEIDNDELIEMYMTTLTTSYDPHSTYMSPETLEDFEIHMRLSLEGIGALLQAEDGTTTVKEVVPGGAADKDKRIKPGDQIVAVGEGDSGEMVDLAEMKLRDVVKLIRGKAGTTVRLEVIPAGQTNRVVYALNRQRIELKDQAAKGEVIEHTDANSGQKYKIGYINLPSFYADQGEGELFPNPDEQKTATNDVRKILEDFNNQGVEGVVFDLRTNGGGLLTEAINLTGLFISEGPIVQVRNFDNEVHRYRDTDKSIAYKGPLVVLISRFSASASEIFAGAIKDYGRGIVVGDSTTHGKGTVQKVLDPARQLRMRAGVFGAVKLTMQQFYRVNGQSTQNRGVTADVVLPSQTDNDEFGEASLDYALEFSEIDKAEYAPEKNADIVQPEVVAKLRASSEARVKTDAKLMELVEKKAKFDERRARKSIAFTEDSLRKERAELKSEGDEEEDSSEQVIPGTAKKDEKFGTDPYSREVLQITSDYLKLHEPAVAAGTVSGQ